MFWLQAAEFFFSSHLFLSQSVITLHCMKPECSLPCSQNSVTCRYPESDLSSPFPPCCFFKIHSCNKLPSKLRSSFRSSSENRVWISLLPIRATSPAHPIALIQTMHYVITYRQLSITISSLPVAPWPLLRLSSMCPREPRLYLLRSVFPTAVQIQTSTRMKITSRPPPMCTILMAVRMIFVRFWE